jgi:hypothetical protein
VHLDRMARCGEGTGIVSCDRFATLVGTVEEVGLGDELAAVSEM